MPYIPRKVVPGKHYAIYTEAKKAKVKTKAAVLKEALDIALEKAEHAEWIDFIPAKFTLQCFDKETEILTDSGWKKFYELAKEDKVAQVRNAKGFTLEFVKPLKIWTQDYEGEMIGIRNDYIDVLVNPEHRFFVKNGTVGKGWHFKTAKVCYGKKICLNPGSVKWDGLFCGHPRWFELLGFFFADGSYQLKGEGKSNNYSLIFTQKNKKQYLENLLSELGLKIQKISRAPEGTILFKIDNKGLGLFFSQFGKRERKHIPSFIRNASPELLRSFLIGYSNGDGYKREGDWRFGGSKQIIDALQEIAIKAGFPARVWIEKPGKGSFSNKSKYTLSISKESIKWVTVNPQAWYKVNYKDRIYSVKVPSGVILIRRNGKPSLQGNCHGWFKEDPKEGYTNLKQIQEAIKSALKSGKDPIKELKGKWHYDLRIQKATAPTWFGVTLFRNPATGTDENKVMGCSDDKTHILTKDGWKLFKDVSKDDYVAQVNPKTNQLSFVKPQEIVSFDYEGELLGVEQQHINFFVTPGHRLYVSPRYWVKTGNGRRWNNTNEKKFKILSAAQAYGQVCHFSRKVELKGKNVNNDWFEFLGFWFAEGSVYFSKKSGYKIVVYQRTKIDYARDLMKRNFTSWNEYQEKNGTWRFVVHDKDLATEFSKYKVGKKGQKGRKKIPSFVFEANREGIRSFIKGYFMGDGTGKEDRGQLLITAFKPLADQLELLLIMSGYSVTVSTQISGKGSLIYWLSFSNRKGLEPKVRANHWVIKYYKGKVYSISVPSGFVITKRNGVYQITGNTVKGYQSIAPGGKKLQEFLLKRAEKEMATEGISERRDRLEWMKIKAQWFPIDSPGNPQKFEPAAMIAIEFFKPACLHRRTLRFLDITFFGDYLKGRYFNRLVERKLNEDELMEWQKEAIKKGKAKEFYQLNFYFWKAKEQWGQPGTKYSMKDVYQAALGKKTLDPLPAPPSKDVEEKEKEKKKTKTEKKVKPPLATKVFH